MTWTPEIVFARFIEAADTEWRSPRERFGPRAAPAFWPEYQHSFTEMREWGDKRLREHRAEFWGERNRPSAAAISRMDEALGWGITLLDADHNKVLWGKCFCLVAGRKFTDWCRVNRLNRRTAYRHFNEALETISASLCRNNVLRRDPDFDLVSQICLVRGIDPVMLGGSAGEIAEAA